jgi:hypothetical protein
MGLEKITEHRGISIETLERCGVYTVDEEPYSVRVPFPNRSGVWYERKLLTPGYVPTQKQQKVLAPSGAVPHLYNPLIVGPNASMLFFCEGEYDTLSVIDCGFDAVGIQGTHTFNKTWARLFAGALNIIAFDGDSSGRKAAEGLRSCFRDLGNNALIMELPDETDVNDLHKEEELEPFLWAFVKENDLLADGSDAYAKAS